MTGVDAVSASDLKRFAICFQNIKDMNNVDWTAAASMYDSNVLVASFKTVTSRALKTAGGVPDAKDHKRFAICFVNALDKQAIDWDQGAHSYDAKVKPASFKTVTMRALRKHGFVAEGSTRGRKKRAASETEVGLRSDDGSDHDLIRTIDEEYGESLAPKRPRKALKTLQPPKEEKDDVKTDQSLLALKPAPSDNGDHIGMKAWVL